MSKPFSKDEMTLLVTLAATGAADATDLNDFFARPARCQKAVMSLIARGLITSAAGQKNLAIRCEEVIEAFTVKRDRELFPDVPGHSRTRNIAPISKPKPPDPPDTDGPGNPSKKARLCRIPLPSLQSEPLPKTLSRPALQTPFEPQGAEVFDRLKGVHKGIKPLQDLESLSSALVDIESGSEIEAYKAMCGILGGVVMEGGDRGPDGHPRFGDGGKWRNRWRNSRNKVHTVLAELVAEIKGGKTIKSRGGRSEFLWNQFYQQGDKS